MKHPTQATLALHAAGDLGLWAQWRTARHTARCENCRDEIAAFDATREIAGDLAEIPEVPWNRLAAEMKANIRLGLAAGECVRANDAPLRSTPLFTLARATVALASILAVTVAGVVLERPAPVLVADEGTVVQATADGIQLRKGSHTFRLMNTGAGRVTYSLDAQGGMGARSVDPDTGAVTVNRVYAD